MGIAMGFVFENKDIGKSPPNLGVLLVMCHEGNDTSLW